MRYIAAMLILIAAPAFSQPKPGLVSLQDLQNALVVAITDASKLSTKPPYFLVKQIDLELQGVQHAEAAGGFSLKVFAVGMDLGASGQSEALQQLSLQLVPAQTIVTTSALTIDLSSLIAELKNVFAHSKNESPKFFLKAVEWELSWTLQYGGSGAINFVVANASTKISQEKAQKVKFILCETVNLRDCAAN